MRVGDLRFFMSVGICLSRCSSVDTPLHMSYCGLQSAPENPQDHFSDAN
jgi:hypothetical protein